MIVAGRLLSDFGRKISDQGRKQPRIEHPVISLRSHIESDADRLGGAAFFEREMRSGQEMPHRVSSREMQDYVEGRLTKQEVARVEAYLRTNPDDAAKVEKLRQQASRMKLFGKALLREEIPQRLLDAIPRKAK